MVCHHFSRKSNQQETSIKSRGYFVKKAPVVEKNSRIVAFVTFIGERTVLNPMYMRLFEGAYSLLRRNNFAFSIYSPDELVSEHIYKNPDFYGFITAGIRNPFFYDALFSTASRFVLTDTYSDIYPSVLTENTVGAELAVKQLIKLGHRKIAIAKGHSEDETFAARLEGYKKVITENKIEIRDDFIFDDLKFPALS